VLRAKVSVEALVQRIARPCVRNAEPVERGEQRVGGDGVAAVAEALCANARRARLEVLARAPRAERREKAVLLRAEVRRAPAREGHGLLARREQATRASGG